MAISVMELFSDEVGQRIGWALVHFLWQGTVVALLLAGLLRVLRRRSAQTRWLVSCIALGLMALLPVMTALLVKVNPAEKAAPVLGVEVASPPATAPSEVAMVPAASPAPALDTPVVTVEARGVPWYEQAAAWIDPALPWLLAAWLIGVLAMSLWHVGGWLHVERAKRRGTRAVEGAVRDVCQRLLVRLRVSRPVRLLESARVAVPMVVGWLRPVVLLPASMVTGLAPVQLEAILAHELAHIRRYDCLVRLLQAVVETLLFYHPAVWWVSRRIAEESELCCDELAVAVSGDRPGYAAALARVAELSRSRPQLAVAASGGRLVSRIRRILRVPESNHGVRLGWLAGMLAITLLAVVGVIVFGCASQRLAGPGHDKATPGTLGVSGVVVDEQGKPVEGAKVAIATDQADVSVSGTQLLGTVITTTDATGRFALPRHEKSLALAAAHDRGYAELPLSSLPADGVVTLQPWGRLEGEVLFGDKPGADLSVGGAYCSDFIPVVHRVGATTDAQGRFVVECVAPPTALVGLCLKTGKGPSAIDGTETYIEIRPGETTRVTLGGKGKPVVGRFKAWRELDWSKVQTNMTLDPPPAMFLSDKDGPWKAWGEFLSGQQGKAYQHYNFPVQPDGSFRLENVPQGTFFLIIWVSGRAFGDEATADTVVTQTSRRFTIAPMPRGHSGEPLDLGTIEIPPPRGSAKADEAPWGEPKAGLRCRWVDQPGPVAAGTRPLVSVEVQNVSNEPVLWNGTSEMTWGLAIVPTPDSRPTGYTMPKFTGKMGAGARPATGKEVREALGLVAPGFKDEDRLPGYCNLAPGASVILTGELPWALSEPGKVLIAAEVARYWPDGSRDYGEEGRMLCPVLELVVVKAGLSAPDIQPAATAAEKTSADQVRQAAVTTPGDKQYFDLDSGGFVSGPDPERQGADLLLRVKDRKAKVVALNMQIAEALFPDGIENPLIEQSDSWIGNASGFLAGAKRQEEQVIKLKTAYFFRTAEGSVGALRAELVGAAGLSASAVVKYRIVQPAPLWGEAVEGVQVRLRAERREWKAGETPTVLADVRNRDRQSLSVLPAQHVFGLELDGQWYFCWPPAHDDFMRVLSRGETCENIAVSLTDQWLNRAAFEASAGPQRVQRLTLTPGRHLLRVGLATGPIQWGPDAPPRAVSNPVEIEILPAVADAPASAKPAEAKPAAPKTESPATPPATEGAEATAAGTRQASFQTLSAMMSSTWIGDRTITVQGDGNYTFEIKPHPQGAGGYEASYRLKAEHLAQLEQLLKATDWLVRPGAKRDPRIEDAVTYTLTVVGYGHKAQVACCGKQPKEYAELLQYIERINRQEWLLYQLTAKPGDRSHAIHDIVSELDAIEGKPSTIKPYAPVLDYDRFVPAFTEVLKHPGGRPNHELAGACRLMGYLRQRSQIESLVALCRHDAAEVREAAVSALGRLGGEEVRKTLLALAEDEKGMTSSALVEALLLELKGPEAVPVLAKMVRRSRYAAWGLIRLGAPAVPTIVGILEHKPDPKDRGPYYLIREYFEHWKEIPQPVSPAVIAAIGSKVEIDAPLSSLAGRYGVDVLKLAGQPFEPKNARETVEEFLAALPSRGSEAAKRMLWMHPLKDDGAEEFIRQAEAGTLKILSVHAAKTSAWATVANAEPGRDVQPFLLVMSFWGGRAWRIDLIIQDAKRTASLLEHFRKTKPDAMPIPPKQSKLDGAKGPATGEAGKEDDDYYRGLYERYKAQILTAVKADHKDEVARLTDTFNESIGGRLLYVRVSRIDPPDKVTTLLNKPFGNRRVSLPNIKYAFSPKPHVTTWPDAGGAYVLIETNNLGGGKYADDVFITMALEPPPPTVDTPATESLAPHPAGVA